MATNAQVAYQAAAIKLEDIREVDLTERVAPFFTWLEANTSASEVQTVTEGGSGLTSFTLTFAGQTTGAIAAGATAAAVQAALVALSNVDPGDIVVTGAAGGPYTLTFGGQYVRLNEGQLTATPTGGSGTVTVATVTQGASALGGNVIGNAQAALLGAAHAYDASAGVDGVNDVLTHAAQLLTDINGHAAGQGS